MHLENQSNVEIQAQIFAEVEKGTNIEIIKAELRDVGKNPEGYYFTTAAKHNAVIQAPKEPAGQLTTIQIISGIITVLFLIIRIARCSNRIH
jgi:hypothetical protein